MANLKEAFEYASKNPNSDFARNLESLAKSGALNIEAKKYNIDLTPFQLQTSQDSTTLSKEEAQFSSAGIPLNQTAKDKQQEIRTKAADFLGGKELAQGLGQTIVNPEISKNLEQTQTQATDIQTNLLQKIKENKAQGLDTSRLEDALKVINENISNISQETGQLLNQNNLTDKQIIGSATQLAANAIPGVGKGAKLATKVAVGAGTGYAFDVGSKLRNNEDTSQALTPGAGTIIGGSLPIVGALTKNLILKPLARITKGLGAGLGGSSTNTLDNIIKNPEKAKIISDALKKGENNKILEGQVKEYINGVSKIRKEASAAFGSGLEQLSKTDIRPDTFRSNVQTFLDKYGISLNKGKRNFSSIEFSDPKNIKKASELIDKLSNTGLDGKSLRKLVDDIENSIYKTATSDERLSFNIFIKDLGSSVRSAITKSTDKLGEINTKYSQDIGLADAIQKIFGKVKFKNLEEINNIAKKIDTLSGQFNGLDEKTVNDFFSRIGKSAQDFKTTNAVRELANKSITKNAEGLNISEITRAVSSGIFTPNLVKNITILTGKTKPVITKILQSSSNTAKKALLNEIANINQTAK